MQPKEYLDNRVDDQINWMSAKSGENQKKYKQLKLAEIITAAAIPLLAGLQQFNIGLSVITGVLGVLLVILSGIQQLYKYHENWITYRASVELLKREKILYETQSGEYNNSDAFARFVQNFEAILANENKVWKDSSTQKTTKE